MVKYAYNYLTQAQTYFNSEWQKILFRALANM